MNHLPPVPSLLTLAAGGLSLLLASAQDPPVVHGPPPPTPPAVVEPGPLAMPPWAVLRRDDLVQRFPDDNPLLGTWQLVRAVRPNQPPPRALRGYVIFTRNYMSLHLNVANAGSRFPSVQSTLRQYRIQNDKLLTQSRIGLRNDHSGSLLLDAEGLQTQRRFVLLGNTLRLHQDDASYLEYQRIE
jgi:hypothetical protein